MISPTSMTPSLPFHLKLSLRAAPRSSDFDATCRLACSGPHRKRLLDEVKGIKKLGSVAELELPA